jgi:hypothetical protein
MKSGCASVCGGTGIRCIKTGRITGREAERRPLTEFEAPMFYLDNQQLKIDEMVRRFHNAQVQIYRRARIGGAACFAVSATGFVALGHDGAPACTGPGMGGLRGAARAGAG